MPSCMRANASVGFSSRLVDGGRFCPDVVDEHGVGRYIFISFLFFVVSFLSILIGVGI